MKKLILLLAAVVALAGCTKEEKVNRLSIPFTVYADYWEPFSYNGGDYPDLYICRLSFPELNNYILNNGSITTYYEYRDGGIDVKVPLPAISTHWKTVDSQEIIWTETIDCEYERGYITVRFTTSDLLYGSPAHGPGRMNFRVVMMW